VRWQTFMVSDTIPNITIPADLLPADGRFGSGPSKVPTEAIEALAATGVSFMGTSHRKDPVKDVVLRLQDGLRQLFALPDDWDVILGNGGATILWDALTFGFIEQRSQHLTFGEFGSKFAKAVQAAPHLSDPMVIESEPGSHPQLVADDSIDTYCFTHNETSTAVAMNIVRPNGASGLMCVDATSGAAGLSWSPDQTDLYYFSPQKCLASDGGLFIALASPAASARIESIASSDRWIPAGLNLKTALDNSRKKQTYNTPALATIFMTMHMVEWLNTNGGMDFATARCGESSDHIYAWADAHDKASTFVTDTAMRSSVNATIDLDDSISADTVAAVLAANGIVGTDGYRKLGRNQLRLAAFPAIDPADVRALTACIDYVMNELAYTPAIGEGNFEQSVILMLHHDADGALGVIINQPSALDVSELLPRWSDLIADPNRIFSGGPVEQNGFIGIGRHSDTSFADADLETLGFAPLAATHRLATVDLESDPAITAAHIDQLRIFRGYAGWGARQLDGELNAGAWFTVASEPDDLWSTEPQGLYEQVLRRQSGDMRWYANAPTDPTVN